MKKEKLVRAMRDAEYRASLNPEEQAQLPAHPSGVVELADTELAQTAGGTALCTTFCQSCFSGAFCCC